MTTIEICNFINPVYWDKSEMMMKPVNSEITKSENWNFSGIECFSTTTDVYTLIENSTTGAEFYVEKTLTYGEAMILWFLTIFTIILLFKTAYNFFWGK